MRSIARPRSWDYYGFDGKSVIAFTLIISFLIGIIIFYLSSSLVGNLSQLLAIISASATSYIIISAPSVALRSSRLIQSREAPSISSSLLLNFLATNSRRKALLLLRVEDIVLKSAIKEIKRRLLLGYEIREVLDNCMRRIASESAKEAIQSVISIDKDTVEEKGEEYEHIINELFSEGETKTPIFIAITFFTPIMLMLLAILQSMSSAWHMIAILFMQLLITNLAFSFMSREKVH